MRWIIFLGLVIPTISPLLADETSLQRFLDAGEFGSARHLAAAEKSSATRDQQLARISESQIAHGAFAGSLATASAIADVSLRSDTLSQMRSGSNSHGALGGAGEADFESLIELITTTIAPESWEEVGGPGAVKDFEGGVYVDPDGMLRQVNATLAYDVRLASLTSRAQHRSSVERGVHTASTLRCVSLNRLERALELTWAAGNRPAESMQALAGLERIRYLMVLPDSRDVVIAGPAGDWTLDQQQRWVSMSTGRPVVRLDDLVLLLRKAFGPQHGKFSCSIDPKPRNLARTQQYIDKTSRRSLPPSRAARARWLRELRDQMGTQTITVKGINPRSRVARVIVEADLQMKMIGMGLADGTMGVNDYFDTLEHLTDGPQPLEVIRWWFTLDYTRIDTLPNRSVFELHGNGTKVLSENEMLSQRGDRRHTGKSSLPATQFAHHFTKNFAQLAVKYAVFAELQNVFDLAMIASIIQAEDLPGRIGWVPDYLLDPAKYKVSLGRAAESVETVINHRVTQGNQIIAGVSGGVSVDPPTWLASHVAASSDDAELEYTWRRASTADESRNWWWDVAP